MGWDIAIGAGIALVTGWLLLIAALVIIRPEAGLLKEALRILPDLLRLPAGWPPTRACPAACESGSAC